MKNIVFTAKTLILVGFLSFNVVQAMQQKTFKDLEDAFDAFYRDDLKNQPPYNTFRAFMNVYVHPGGLRLTDDEMNKVNNFFVFAHELGSLDIKNEITTKKPQNYVRIPIEMKKEVEGAIEATETLGYASISEEAEAYLSLLDKYHYFLGLQRGKLLQGEIMNTLRDLIDRITDNQEAKPLFEKAKSHIDRWLFKAPASETLLQEYARRFPAAPETAPAQKLEREKRFIRNNLGNITSVGYDQNTAQKLLNLLQSNDNKLNSQDFLDVQNEFMDIIMDAISKLSSKYSAEINNLKTKTLNIVIKWTFKAPKTQEFIQTYSIQPPTPAPAPAPAAAKSLQDALESLKDSLISLKSQLK